MIKSQVIQLQVGEEAYISHGQCLDREETPVVNPYYIETILSAHYDVFDKLTHNGYEWIPGWYNNHYLLSIKCNLSPNWMK